MKIVKIVNPTPFFQSVHILIVILKSCKIYLYSHEGEQRTSDMIDFMSPN